MTGRRGATLLELLVGTALGLAVLAVLTAAVGVAGRMLVASGTRAESEDTEVHLALGRRNGTERERDHRCRVELEVRRDTKSTADPQ